ncbi:hypothetical protein Nepgr_007286 [Nepenthes gracilis]|uniref:Large ribosomal subunit protein bL21m n=1 Tax=Nepenthes gracilis TaxID=150966 RepID=A0AAD3XIC9_NEPGR|nr:hypothetical protein Nepgr_007286 [Nepenthes gracilis]
MACRRCLKALTRHAPQVLQPSSQSLQPLKSHIQFHSLILQRLTRIWVPRFNPQFFHSHDFSSQSKRPSNSKFTDDEDNASGSGAEDDEETSEKEGEIDGNEERDIGNASGSVIERAYSVEEKIKEAADIGYKVTGQLQRSDRVFKPYEPVFAIVQIGSHQFKVSNGDCIYTERLKYCEVNDKLILNKVLLLGSKSQTIVGRPIVPDAAVHAVVEEHALDAKVIIFKKKRRKNYRRTKGHRQELTRLRITDIQGIEKPGEPSYGKMEKASEKMVEKVAVAA